MIRLRKGPPPKVLVEKAAQWTAEYLDALNGTDKLPDTIRFRYRHPDIKAALRRDSHNKCIYCEGLIGFGETDHINPVTACPDQIALWDNLGLVCKECNTHKGDYCQPAEPLINPFPNEPAECLIFLGAIVIPIPGNAMGIRTELRLKLNRMDLIQKRTLRLQRLTPLVHQWKDYPDGPTKDLLAEALLDQAADKEEYAATVRAFLRHVLDWHWPGRTRVDKAGEPPDSVDQ